MATKLDTKKWEDGLNGLKKPELATFDADGGLAKMQEALINRQPFSYDVMKDPMYQGYKDQAVRGGKMAMQDTMGNAAALSGGYGNSYAATAGNQAYQQYLSGLNDVIPELYNAAYNRYQTDLANQRADYDMMANAEQGKYNRSLDAVNLYNTDRNYYYGGLMDATQFNYNAEQDTIKNNLNQAQFDETVRANKASEGLAWANYNANQANAAASVAAEQNTAYQKQIANVKAALDKMEEDGKTGSEMYAYIANSGLDSEDMSKFVDLYDETRAYEASREKAKASGYTR